MKLLDKINDKSAIIGIIGMGYVGLPLGLEFASKGFNVIGFDLDETKVKKLNEGESYIKHISESRIKNVLSKKTFSATTQFEKLPEADAIIICVPTPLDDHREPDMTYIISTTETIAKYIRKGQLVSLESTTYPGTTDEILRPMFENAGERDGGKKFEVGKDFYLSFSPEREDPNNPDFNTATIPKVVGGETPECVKVATALYNNVVVKTIPVSSTRAAEATKLTENIYRSVNIALVNELKMVFDRMNIDVWEVIDAAATKPFGFQPFYPGPGLGGHCIPIDPFYLTWKAREYEVHTRFIELAGEVNTFMPYYVVEKSGEALNRIKKSLNGSKVLILGVAYKRDVDDMRESPSLRLIELFREKGCEVSYNDPYVNKLPRTRKYQFDMRSVELNKENLSKFDLVVLSTDHSNYDYKMILDSSKLIVDSRNAFSKRGIVDTNKIVKA